MTLEEFRQDTFKAVNEKRRIHNAPAMTLDAGLNERTHSFAKWLASERKFEHSPAASRPNEGENVFKECASHGKLIHPSMRWILLYILT